MSGGACEMTQVVRKERLLLELTQYITGPSKISYQQFFLLNLIEPGQNVQFFKKNSISHHI
jgi:hypothetical protein